MSKKISLVTKKGIDGEVSVPSAFMTEHSESLVAQVIHVQTDHKHKGLAKAKTRGEVLLTKKKVYKQKHTGGARHGAKSAPLFVGGGVTHGPKGVKRYLELPREFKKKAASTIFGKKVENGQVFAFEAKEISKTKDAQNILKAVNKKRNVVFLGKENLGLMRFFRNIKDVQAMPLLNINAYDLFFAQAIFMDSSIFPKVSEAKPKKTIKPKSARIKKTSK